MKRFLIVLFTLLVTASGHAAPAGKKQAPPVPVTVLDGETSSDLAAGEIMIHGGYRRSLRPSYCKLRSTISTSFTN